MGSSVAGRFPTIAKIDEVSKENARLNLENTGQRHEIEGKLVELKRREEPPSPAPATMAVESYLDKLPDGQHLFPDGPEVVGTFDDEHLEEVRLLQEHIERLQGDASAFGSRMDILTARNADLEKGG